MGNREDDYRELLEVRRFLRKSFTAKIARFIELGLLKPLPLLRGNIHQRDTRIFCLADLHAVQESLDQHHSAGGILFQRPAEIEQHLALLESDGQFVFRFAAVDSTRTDRLSMAASVECPFRTLSPPAQL